MNTRESAAAGACSLCGHVRSLKRAASGERRATAKALYSTRPALSTYRRVEEKAVSLRRLEQVYQRSSKGSLSLRSAGPSSVSAVTALYTGMSPLRGTTHESSGNSKFTRRMMQGPPQCQSASCLRLFFDEVVRHPVLKGVHHQRRQNHHHRLRRSTATPAPPAVQGALGAAGFAVRQETHEFAVGVRIQARAAKDKTLAR